MSFFRPEIFVFVFLMVSALSLFSWLSVTSYLRARRAERDAYYRNETVRRLTESQGAGAEAAIKLVREEDRLGAARRIESVRLGGLITAAIGIGIMLFFAFIDQEKETMRVGIAIGSIPILVGAALLLYAYVLAPKRAADGDFRLPGQPAAAGSASVLRYHERDDA